MVALAKGRKRSDAAVGLISDIASNEKQIQSSADNLNPLVDILKHALDPKAAAKVTHAAIYALHRIFSSLIRQGRVLGKLQKSAKLEDVTSVRKVREWTKARYGEYTDRLAVLLSSNDISLHLSALSIMMDLLRIESEVFSTLSPGGQHRFAEGLWRKFMIGLLCCGDLPSDLKAEFVVQYLNVYDDVRYYFLKGVASLASPVENSAYLLNTTETLSILEQLTSMPLEPSHLNNFLTTTPERLSRLDSGRSISKASNTGKKRKRPLMPLEDGSTGVFDASSSSSESEEAAAASLPAAKMNDLMSVNEHRKVFQLAWLAVLSRVRDVVHIKRVLVILDKHILPHMPKPNLLLDFLVDSCDQGGTVALLALNSLFTLMTKHNLDYPNFYTRLYALLDGETMHVKHRTRFFRMLDLFLGSSHLPIALVASFVKRLSRLSLSAPPAAIVTIIPFVYNIMKKHPQLVQLVHREPAHSGAVESHQHVPIDDPFLPGEMDPLKTMAIDSSLWEISSLVKHYLASISTLAKIFSQHMTKPQYDLEDFLDHSYTSLFEASVQRELKKAPALDLPPIVAKQVDLFPKSDAVPTSDSPAWSDLVTELWSF